MTTTDLLTSYANGNCAVSLMRDGTKIREWEGEPFPDHPESIDLKITNFCDASCRWCHEMSTKRGVHAKTADVLRILNGLPRGAEIAIGGGDPLSHPELDLILEGIRDRGMVANLTVNEKHFPCAVDRICSLQSASLVYGVGVSVADVRRDTFWRQMHDLPEHLVYHVIVGLGDPQSLIRHGRDIARVLVLGYKRFGFGAKCDEAKITDGINRWRYWIGTILKKFPSVSFDNLALKQLGIRDRIEPTVWAQHYMGDDGRFTMYVDAVRNEFAVSSTSPRRAIEGRSTSELFRSLRED